MKKYLYAASISILILIWILWAIGVNNRLIVPTPLMVLQKLGQMALMFETYEIILLTILRLVISVVLSFVLAAVLGIFGGVYKNVETLLSPVVSILRCTPVVAVIIIIWMTFSDAVVPYVICFLIVFPIIYQAILDGMRGISKHETMDVYRLDSEISFYVIRHLHVPYLIPYMALSLMQGVGLGIKALVTAEFMVQTKKSIGRSIAEARPALEIDTVFAWAIILVIIVIIFEVLIKKGRTLFSEKELILTKK